MAFKKGIKAWWSGELAVWVEAQVPVALHLQLPRVAVSTPGSGTTSLGVVPAEK